PSPRKFRNEIPRGLASAVERCLAKQPGDRFKSYAELARVLAPFGSGAPTPATLGFRVLAGLLDSLILSALSSAITWSTMGGAFDFIDVVSRKSVKGFLILFASFAVQALYFSISENRWGATLGKALCRLRVVDQEKNPPSFLRAVVRASMYIILPILPSLCLYGITGAAAFRP